MKSILIALGLAMVGAAGCAHGTASVGGDGRDVRGSARVSQEAKLLLVGPAQLVHADGEKPVRWFVAERVNGDDRDCTGAATGQVVLSEGQTAHLTVGSGQVLCAAVAKGATDVMWHEVVAHENGSMWALR
jgi:hypothetical protein